MWQIVRSKDAQAHPISPDKVDIGEPGNGTGVLHAVCEIGPAEGGEEAEITTIAAKKDRAKVGQAVDGLFDRGQVAGGRPIAMFQFVVVLERTNTPQAAAAGASSSWELQAPVRSR